MKRRDFLWTCALWPLTAQAQQAARKRRLTILLPSVPNSDAAFLYELFFRELGRQGFKEGESVDIDRVYGNNETGDYLNLAKDVARAGPDAIFVVGGPLTSQLKSATQTIPIISAVADPVAIGLVSSLARPGGNITGVTVDGGLQIYGKRLQLLGELVHNLKRVGYVASSANWDRATGLAARAAAERAGVALAHIDVGTTFNQTGYEAAFSSTAANGVDGLLISDEAEHSGSRRALIPIVERLGRPAIYPFRSLVQATAGGLMAYSVDFGEVYKNAAMQVADVLRGKNPADMPFVQPVKFKLILNIVAARRIGIEIPVSLLASADEVIE